MITALMICKDGSRDQAPLEIQSSLHLFQLIKKENDSQDPCLTWCCNAVWEMYVF